MIRFSILGVLLFFSGLYVTAQEPTAFKYKLRGNISDGNSVVFPGLRLVANKDNSTLTDINGDFSISLADGEYVMTVDGISPEKFQVFLKITEKGLNPEFLDLRIVPTDVACSGDTKAAPRTIIRTADVIYPPAARAIRAAGEVLVRAIVNGEGKVLSAQALRGHPLLRRAAEQGVEKFVFNASDSALNQEVTVIYVFLPEQYEKPNLKRFTCSYRVVVVSKAQIIDTGEH